VDLKSPICVASGPWGLPTGVDLSCIGAWTTKTVTPESRNGNDGETLLPVLGGFINRLGLPNPGIEEFIESYVFSGVPTFVSLADFSPFLLEKWVKRISELEGVIGIELNTSCPNADDLTFNFACLATKVAHIKRETGLLATVKLAPNLDQLSKVMPKCRMACPDALVISNSAPSMVGGMTGGLSGPALKPLSLRCVHEALKVPKIEVIGCGGVTCGQDVVDYLNVGAKYVQVGSIHLKEPDATTRIMSEYLDLIAA